MRVAIGLVVMACLTNNVFAAWFDGGTLHGASLKEWKVATPSNQLATAGDMVGKATNGSNVDEIKEKAFELKACINVVANNPQMRDLKVATVAVICLKQLEYI